MNIIIIILVGILAGIIASLGLGGGAVLILYLTFVASVEQKIAQGINLLFFIPCAILSIIVYKKKGLIDFNVIKSTVVYGILGGLLGGVISVFIQPDLLKTLFGIMLLIFGVKTLFNKND